ncbi:hypothetical protein DYB25_009123 [Aphanomyces astaci]|uniref:ATP-dependent RNA helicase DHX37-like C-terminal domain-containing protein n=1 Tax=Aphanomyces astaci TaxID=112090 RepID=A0A397DJJ3_APHAT|nr:hypothetical protein DYB25_009123 [Aphanomyces astaci]RHY06174.1 hypothetical protein DYB36_003740 [Aphanomyces astaci]RHY51105.1 hypothetical protein DYB30_010583 [Aphanomyces astaci]RHY64037.1 hypothetical protein DYB34_010872 [Aphanomyces astaci]RHY65622.1 hypothetical protein DYB38_001460 [Aphanomyces astaci]
MLLLAQQVGCLEYAIAVVASLTGQSPFILERERKEAESYRKEANDEDKLPSIDAESSEPQKNEMTQVDNAWTEELKEAEAMQRHAQWMDDDSDVEYPAGPVKFRWFGRFLLDGLVVSALKPLLATKLREPSVSLIKKKFDAKIQLLVSALERSNVSSRRALVAQWQRNPQFLREQVLNWVQDNHKAALKQHWNDLVMRQVQAL